MVRDQDGSVNQSLFLTIFLNSISILFKLLPFVKYSLLDNVFKFTSFSFISKIFNAFKEELGIKNCVSKENSTSVSNNAPIKNIETDVLTDINEIREMFRNIKQYVKNDDFPEKILDSIYLFIGKLNRVDEAYKIIKTFFSDKEKSEYPEYLHPLFIVANST